MLISRYSGVWMMLFAAAIARGQAGGPGGTGAGAASRDGAPQATRTIAPYIDAQTLLAGHLDASLIDTAAAETFMTQILNDTHVPADAGERKNPAMARAAADAFLARFKQLGGRHVFLVLNQADVYPGQPGPAILIKLEPGGDARAMAALLQATFGDPSAAAPGDQPNRSIQVMPLRDDILFVGLGKTLRRLQTIQPAARENLAFPGGDPAAVEFVAALTADQRRVLSDLMPTPPPELGVDSLEPLVKGLDNLSIQLRLPPAPNLTVALTMTNAADAAQVSRMAESVRDKLLADTGLKQSLEQPELKPAAENVLAMIRQVLTPQLATVAGKSVLTFQITDLQISQTAMLLMPAMDRARTLARRPQSMSNIKQILIAAIMYADEHKNVLPESLDVLVKSGAIPAQVLVDPADPKARPFVYKRWAPTGMPDANIPLVWEDTDDPNEGMNVGFADGHVEYFQRRKDVEALWTKAEEWAKKQTVPGK